MSWILFLVGSIALSATILHAEANQGWIGASIGNITPELAESFELDEPQGVLVWDVDDDGPANKAGIQRGDIITHFQGELVMSTRDLVSRVARLSPGSTAEMRVRTMRGHAGSATVTIQTFVVTIQEYPYDGPRDIPTDPFTAGWRTTPAWAADGDTLCRTYNRLVTKCVEKTCSELPVSSRRELAVTMAKEIRPGVSDYANTEREWLIDEIMKKCPQVR